MLSNIDIKKELGKNIYIYPVYPSSIKSNSIDFHMSKFGWSLKTKKSLQINDKLLTIPANDTALIYTEESIHLTSKIGGSIHSRASLVARGLGHISTTLDANYVGNLLIALHNYSDKDIELEIGTEFITLHLFYLTSPPYPELLDNPAGIIRDFSGFSTDEYRAWARENPWIKNVALLFHAMNTSHGYKQCKEEYEIELRYFSRHKIWHWTKRIVFCSTIALFVTALFSFLKYSRSPGDQAFTITSILQNIIFPVLSSTITFACTDFFEKKKKNK